jgi:predicted GNAT family acetyltransferase
MKLLFENWREYIKEAQEISIEIEGATIDGVVHDNPERLMNWANSQGVSEEVLQNLELPVAIMKNAFVPEENRSQGVGNQLVEDFMSKAADAGAYTTILIADLGQSQAEGFSLVDWYEGYGFEVVGKDSGGNPVMVRIQ